jgi:transposase
VFSQDADKKRFVLVPLAVLCETMAMREPLVSDVQWRKIEPLLPQPKRRRRGRPPKANRVVFEAILWILRSGARWRDLPRDFGVSPSVCWKRLQLWESQEIWLRMWRAFLSELDEQGRLDWSESFLDGSFAPAKKGALLSEKPSGARGQSGWWWSTAKVFLWEANWPALRQQK